MKRYLWVGIAVLLVVLVGCQNQYITGGKLYLQQNNPEKAVEQFKKAIEMEPDNVDGYLWLGKAYTLQKKYKDASYAFLEAINKGAKSKMEAEDPIFYWTIFLDAGIEAFNEGKYDSSIVWFEMALEFNPDSASTYRFIGVSYAKMGDEEKKREFYQKALERSPGDPKMIFALARDFIEDEEYEMAEGLLNKALDKDEDGQLHYLLGVMRSRQERFEEAAEAFNFALSKDPENIDTHFNIGLAYIKLKKFSDASVHFRKVVDVNPEDKEAWFYLGYVLAQDKKYQDAVDAFTKVLELDPDYCDAYVNRALAYDYLGKKKLARRDREKAIECKKRMK